MTHERTKEKQGDKQKKVEKKFIGYYDTRPLNFGDVIYYENEKFDPREFTGILKFTKHGKLDRRFKCNRGYTIKNHIQDFYDRKFIERML